MNTCPLSGSGCVVAPVLRAASLPLGFLAPSLSHLSFLYLLSLLTLPFQPLQCQCFSRFCPELACFLSSLHVGLNSVPPQISVHLEPQNVTLFGTRVLAEVIS